jgi:prephenate dehydrogenase
MTRIAVLGVGLIGGSIGLAARRRVESATVAGWDPDPRALERALERGAIDSRCESVVEALDGAEICFVCAPVSGVAATARAALECGGDCVVSDVGSVKLAVLEELAASGLPDSDLERFVGGHPLAGAEAAGVDHAREELFEGATWYLTPNERTVGLLYERLYRMLASMGARPSAITADVHDRLMATVSHLPHVLANVLVGQAASELVEESQGLPATGPSFRDATRVAGANPSLWRDIFVSNREAIVRELDAYCGALNTVSEALRAGDGEALERWIEGARADRQRLLEGELAGGPVSELRVPVPNQPGIVAQIALALSEAGINIIDMALYPAPDMRSGAIALWVAGEGSAERAAELVAGLGYAASPVDGGDK